MDNLIWGEYLLLLFFLIFIGLINIPIAWSKGRSTVRWFFLGFLLGPLGLVLLLFIPMTQVQKDEKALVRGELQKCPSCAEFVKAEAIKCRHCGDSLNIEDQPQQSVEIVEDEALKACPSCAELIEAEAIECLHCGTRLNLAEQSQRPVGTLESGELESSGQVPKL